MTKNSMWFGVIAAIASLALSVPAEARSWRQQGQPSALPKDAVEAARDYAHITDLRSTIELVSVQWLAPIANPDDPQWQTLLDTYVVIGVTRAVPRGDSITFEPKTDEVPNVTDKNGKSLKLIPQAEMQPDIAQFITAKTEQVHNTPIPREVYGPNPILQRMFEAYQKGFRFFVFENGDVHACTTGGLAVTYADERYTFETPFPGCDAAKKKDQNNAN